MKFFPKFFNKFRRHQESPNPVVSLSPSETKELIASSSSNKPTTSPSPDDVKLTKFPTIPATEESSIIRTPIFQILDKAKIPSKKKINFYQCTMLARIVNIADGDTFDVITCVSDKVLAKYNKHEFTSKDEMFQIPEVVELLPGETPNICKFTIRLLGWDAYESNTYHGLLAQIMCFGLFTKNQRIKVKTIHKLGKFPRSLATIEFYHIDTRQWIDYGGSVLGQPRTHQFMKDCALQTSYHLGRSVTIHSMPTLTKDSVYISPNKTIKINIPKYQILLGIPYQGTGKKAPQVSVAGSKNTDPKAIQKISLKKKYNWIKLNGNKIMNGVKAKDTHPLSLHPVIKSNPDIKSPHLLTVYNQAEFLK